MKKKVLFLGAVALTACLVLLLHTPAAVLQREHYVNVAEPTIFVSVASYRDDDCSNTLRDLYAKAKYPSRIFVGVCQQNKPGEMGEECVDPQLPYRQNVRVITLRHTEAKGPTYARYKCATLYENETYFCQIDSHTLFVKHWDVIAIEDLLNAPSPNPILSYYPHDSKSNALDVTSVPVLCKSKFDADGIISFEAITQDPTNTYKPIPFLAGGFFFGPGSLLNVPFDPSLDHLFQGEEILYSARLWTTGFDFYAPQRNLCLHYYTRKDKPKYWEDLHGYRESQKASQQKVVRLLGLDGKPPMTGYPYGLGTQRSLHEYFAFAGIDPVTRTSTSQAKFCSV